MQMKSLSLDTSFLLLFLILCLLHLCYPARGQRNVYFCGSSPSNHTSDSTYAQNLNLTLNSIAANASKTGFFITSVGQTPDIVYGLIQCSGDVPNSYCQTCATMARTEITRVCPNMNEAYIGYNNCSLHYSSWRFFSNVNSNLMCAFVNAQNATDPTLFNRQLGSLLKNMSYIASASPSRFATGRTDYTDFSNIHAIQQCTEDLGVDSCFKCFEDIISYIPQECSGSVGCHIFSMSCTLRYEIYSFTSLSSPPPPNLQVASSPSTPPYNSVPSQKENSNNGKNISTTIIVLTVAVIALVVICLMCGCLFWRKAKRKLHDGFEEYDRKSAESLLFGLHTLKVSTGNFSDAHKLGEGGFGAVYKGTLPNGQKIAVKRLSSSSRQGLEELKTEVLLVAKLLHRNLVKLLGFCLEEEEKLLVYEYLPNRSLDKCLFDKSREPNLKWEERYKVIVGIARGLLYLHEDSQLRIIHRDMKASNILLDEDMNPKISDFGLAKLFSESQLQGNTNRIAGTYGYMAPEYAKRGHFSTKSDVYSFGILLLEIVTGIKNSGFREVMNIQSYAWQHWVNGTAMDLLDLSLCNQCSKNEVIMCIHVGLLCVQELAVDRPTMSEIMTIFSDCHTTYSTPSRPAFFVSSKHFTSDYTKDNSDTGSQVDRAFSDLLPQSVNEVSITELYAR